MATDAMRPQAVRRHRPLNPASDRVFFVVMIVVLWATVLFGFARTYFLAGMVRAPLPNLLIHIHGAAFTLWMVLLTVQIGLVSAGQVRWHKRLGLTGFGLAVAMVVLGLLAATDALHRGSDGGTGLGAKTFYVIPLTAVLTFAVLVYFAYRTRSRPADHKRLILIATIAIMDAAVGRWPIAILHTQPQLQDVVLLGFLLIVVAYDLLSQHRFQKATLWASALLIVVHLVRVPFGMSPAWQAFATWVAAKS
jgi:hypothetical protein